MARLRSPSPTLIPTATCSSQLVGGETEALSVVPESTAAKAEIRTESKTSAPSGRSCATHSAEATGQEELGGTGPSFRTDPVENSGLSSGSIQVTPSRGWGILLGSHHGWRLVNARGPAKPLGTGATCHSSVAP